VRWPKPQRVPGAFQAAELERATAALASSPNSEIGACSGVTSVTVTSSWPMLRASPAVISASSYAGSGDTAPGGTTIASRFAWPSSMSRSRPP
jgi:hypothetical protein